MTAQVVTVASGNGTGSAYSVTKPSGTVNGDLLIAAAASDWGTLAASTVPTGFTALTTSDFDGGLNAVHLALGYKIASGEGASYSFPVGASADHVAALLRIDGHDPAGVISQVAPVTISSGSGAIAAPSITTGRTDDLLLCFGVVDGAGGGSGGAIAWTVTGAGLAEQIDRQSGSWTSLGVGSLQDPSTPSGTKTLVTAPTGHGAGCAATISIKSIAVAATSDVIKREKQARLGALMQV